MVTSDLLVVTSVLLVVPAWGECAGVLTNDAPVSLLFLPVYGSGRSWGDAVNFKAMKFVYILISPKVHAMMFLYLWERIQFWR